MPTYEFKNLKTGELEEHKMSYTKLDEFKYQNPHLERHFSIEDFPVYSDGMRLSVPGTGQGDSTFEKYVIAPMMRNYPGNNLARSHKTKIPKEW